MKSQSFHFQLSCTNSQGERTQQEFTLSERDEKHWAEGLHDAMSDSLATYSRLRKFVELNGHSNIVELVKHFPQCRLDTELFDSVERMLTEGKTSDDNLMTVAAKAGEFYGTMPSLRGKTLAETPRLTIQGALMSGYERDDRICLIYKAAMLQKEVDCPPKRQLPNPLDTSPKKPKAD